MIKAIATFLDDKKIEYSRDYALKSASSFRIGGSCAIAVFPRSENELVGALEALDVGAEMDIHVYRKEG